MVAEESYLRIWVGCARGVLNADKKGKSDPYAVLTTKNLWSQSSSSPGKSVVALHRTRVIDDSLDPNFNEWCTFLMPPSWSTALKKLQRIKDEKNTVATKDDNNDDDNGHRYPEDIEINIALYDYDEVMGRYKNNNDNDRSENKKVFIGHEFML